MFDKVNSAIMYGLIALGVVLMILTMSSGLTPEQSDCVDCGAVGSFIGLSYILLLVAIVAAVGGAIFQAIQNPSKIKGSLIGLGALAAILIISYVMADGTVQTYYKVGTSETASKLSGAGLYALYILFVLAVLSIAYSSVSRLLK
jgi:ABC-type enterochelin transport system permease subunit